MFDKDSEWQRDKEYLDIGVLNPGTSKENAPRWAFS